MDGLTIYTAPTAERANRSYFKRLKQSEPGIAHVAMGHAMPIFTADYSLIVVRRSHRVERQGYHLLTPSKRYFRTYYVVSRRDFVLVTISWDTGFVTELSNYATRKEADVAMRAAHTARFTGSTSRELAR